MADMEAYKLPHEPADAFTALFNEIEDYIFIVGESGTIINANHAAVRGLKYSLPELCSMKIFQLHAPPEHHETLAAACPPPFRTKEGHLIPVKARTFTGKWQGKDVNFRIYKQITSTEQELEKSRAAAEKASTLKSQFLANMTHEIRTPMNGIIGFVDLLSRTELTREQTGFLHEIQIASSALLLLINHILDYSKIEAEKLELERILFNIYELLEDSVALFTPVAYEKGIEMHLQVSPHIPDRLYGDPARLRQVLNNFIGNAMKFTPAGEIIISLSLLEDHEDRVKVRFTVTDTGIGMSQEVLGRLFRVFSQADVSTTRRFGGTGLGLAISHKLIEMMGGIIRVESAPDMGSTFYVELELEKDHTGAGTEDKSTGRLSDLRSLITHNYNKMNPFYGVDLQNKNEAVHKILTEHSNNNRLNLLLVEDTAVNRKLAGIMLKQLGYNVDFAANGQEAVEICTSKKYDLILMDCQMPIMDGYKATTEIRVGTGKNKRTCIIAMTANAMDGDREKCLSMGMNDYLSKPVKMDQLGEILKKWLY